MDKEEYILVKYGSGLTVGVDALFYLRILPDSVFDLFFCQRLCGRPPRAYG